MLHVMPTYIHCYCIGTILMLYLYIVYVNVIQKVKNKIYKDVCTFSYYIFGIGEV